MTRFSTLLFAVVFTASAFFQPDSGDLQAFDRTGCEMDCQKCHSIGNQDLKEILQKVRLPNVEVKSVQMSPVNGLWEISVFDKGRALVFYVDFSKKFVLSGQIIEVGSGKNRTAEQVKRLQESRRVDFSKIPLNQGLVMGDLLAPLKVAVFTDPDCPYCEKLHREMEKVLEERKDIVFHIILYPLSFHKEAYWKSKSILCNKSVKMLGDAFARKEIPRTECGTKEIDANIKLAGDLGITGTPSLVLPDGRIHTGMMPAKQLIAFILGGNKSLKP